MSLWDNSAKKGARPVPAERPQGDGGRVPNWGKYSTAGGTFTNAGAWMLILGVDIVVGLNAANATMKMTDPGGFVVQSAILFNFANQLGGLTAFKWLVPPEYKITTSVAIVNFHALTGEFEDLVKLI